MSMREEMQRTGKCPLCGHDAEEHRQHCRHIDTWLGLHRREFKRCDCHMSGPEDWAAGAMWNAYMGRSS
jgi:hypothetical protein